MRGFRVGAIDVVRDGLVVDLVSSEHLSSMSEKTKWVVRWCGLCRMEQAEVRSREDPRESSAEKPAARNPLPHLWLMASYACCERF